MPMHTSEVWETYHEDPDTDTTFIIVVIVLVFVVFILACVIGYMCYRFRIRSGGSSLNNAVEQGTIPPSSMSTEVIELAAYNPQHVRDDETGEHMCGCSFIPSTNHTPIRRELLPQVFKDTAEHSADEKLNKEFKELPSYQDLSHSCTEQEKNQNKEKNRYGQDIAICYDHSRVKLKAKDSDHSDFINANYLPKYDGQFDYIVTQGPLPNTVEDFWQMVWEQNCRIIVMTCNLQIGDRELVSQYWPEVWETGKTQTYGKLRLQCLELKEYADYTIRRFNLWQGADDSVKRQVQQFHYTAWHDDLQNLYICPKSVVSFVDFLELVTQTKKDDDGPMLVHCSAGTGQVGIFIVLREMKNQLLTNKTVDVFNYVLKLRHQRSNIVHVPSNYLFIYRALVDLCTLEEVSCELDVQKFTEKVKQYEELPQRHIISQEYERLNLLTKEDKPTLTGLTPENAKKNKHGDLIIPFEDNRVKIRRRDSCPDGDYVNASWIRGYRDSKAFIITQDPLKETAQDFWQMVWEYDITVVVMLTKPGPLATHCFQYWPTEEDTSSLFDSTEITLLDEDCYPDYTVRKFKIKHIQENVEKTVTHFHYRAWPDDAPVPPCASAIIDMIDQVNSTVAGHTVLVHCSGGGDRSSVFCGISCLLERLRCEGKVDVFKVTCLLRDQRQYMIPTVDEYFFMYKAIIQYISDNVLLGAETETNKHALEDKQS